MYPGVIKKEGSSIVAMGAGLRSAASLADDYVSPPKYKSSLLHRYLNDSLRHVMVANGVVDARKRNHSGSFSSNEYDDELLSPSSSEAEANFVYRAGKEHVPALNFSRFCSLVLRCCFLRFQRVYLSCARRYAAGKCWLWPNPTRLSITRDEGSFKKEFKWWQVKYMSLSMSFTKIQS